MPLSPSPEPGPDRRRGPQDSSLHRQPVQCAHDKCTRGPRSFAKPPPAIPDGENLLCPNEEGSRSADRGLVSVVPPPAYYHHPLALHPYPFVGLGTFIAGRINQMRAGKSYQAAHPSWRAPEADTSCPRCCLEPESFEHSLSSLAPLQRAPAHASSTASLVSVMRPPSGPLSPY